MAGTARGVVRAQRHMASCAGTASFVRCITCLAGCWTRCASPATRGLKRTAGCLLVLLWCGGLISGCSGDSVASMPTPTPSGVPTNTAISTATPAPTPTPTSVSTATATSTTTATPTTTRTQTPASPPPASPPPARTPPERDFGVCYEQVDCAPLPFATHTDRLFCCSIALQGSFSWCSEADIDPVSGLCTHCAYPCQRGELELGACYTQANCAAPPFETRSYRGRCCSVAWWGSFCTDFDYATGLCSNCVNPCAIAAQ
jgi:hypothetical protein